jgi:hypothetical protein
MSCYTSHLDGLLREAGIEPTKPNRRQVHIMLRRLTGEDHCPQVWRRVKALVADPCGREELASKLRDEWEAATATE